MVPCHTHRKDQGPQQIISLSDFSVYPRRESKKPHLQSLVSQLLTACLIV